LFAQMSPPQYPDFAQQRRFDLLARRRGRGRLLLSSLVALAACRARPQPAAPVAPPPASSAAARSFYADRFSRRATVAEMTALGRALFFDASLSASGRMSCATCHDPRFAFGPPDDGATPAGGPDLKSPGLRAVPSLRYLQTVPPFEEHHTDENGADQGPAGGYGWDGRAGSTHDQARLPLTSPLEMANPDVATVVAKVAGGPLAARFRAAFGDDLFDDPARGETAVLKCLEVFQQSPADFYPYRSRYDAALRGQGRLSAAERRGLALFEDPRKGNCARCHPTQIRNGAFPQLTDYGFNALGVPRNRALAANRDPSHHDLGLCGPLRRDLAAHFQYCGLFRVPSLRNVALRRAFFHNGVFHTLQQVLDFYVQRDVAPARFYGKNDRFDDLPPAYRNNVDQDPPFGARRDGTPALSRDEIRDVIAFLGALTDQDLAPE
jgi:cytochrome c peroxidase